MKWGGARGRWRRRLRRIALRVARALFLAAGAGVVLSLLVVVLFRWVSPPTTAFMLQHRWSVWRDGGTAPAVRYRWVDWSGMNPELGLAVVAAEDQRFPEHHGLDFEAIGDAFDERRAGGRLRGASTISQQVAKNLFLWPGRSLVRKGIEGYLAVLIDLVWTKRRVLEVYLNVAEFGEGVYGVGAASEQFFDSTPSELDRSDAAILAAVLPSPKRLLADQPSPYLLERQRWIVDQMGQLGGIGYLDRR